MFPTWQFWNHAIAVIDIETLNLLETQTAICELKIPDIPTLLSFREIPPALAAIKKLKSQPDVFLGDAQGLAHPYRCGFASHLGLALGKHLLALQIQVDWRTQRENG